MSQLKKILLVEDSEELLKVWVALFKTMPDYAVKAVSKGSTAIELFEDGFEPDILITDFYLGDCTGIDLIKRLKKYSPQLRSIVVTGNQEDETLKKWARESQIDLLIKPVKFKQLKEVIKGEKPSLPVSSEHSSRNSLSPSL